MEVWGTMVVRLIPKKAEAQLLKEEQHEEDELTIMIGYYVIRMIVILTMKG
jgi:hypothetical protein